MPGREFQPSGKGMARRRPGAVSVVGNEPDRVRGQFGVREQVRVGPGDLRQGDQDLAQVAAHGPFGAFGVARLDVVDDRLVLADKQRQRRGFRQAEIAHPVGLDARALDDAPGVVALDNVGDGAVEGSSLSLKRQ